MHVSSAKPSSGLKRESVRNPARSPSVKFHKAPQSREKPRREGGIPKNCLRPMRCEIQRGKKLSRRMMQSAQAKSTTKRLLTVPETASYLNCSLITVRRLIWAGCLPTVRWDRRQRVDTRDLERFIEQNKARETL